MRLPCRGKALMSLSVILILLVMAVLAKNDKSLPRSEDPVKSLILSSIVASILIGVMLWYFFSFKILLYSNYTIVLSDDGLKRYIDIDASQLTGLKKFSWQRAERINPPYVFLRWADIKSVVENNHGLFVKTSHSGSLFGAGQIIVPKQMENYEELKQQIKSITHLKDTSL